MRIVAFLRGINLGNRRIKMDRLREHFEELGLEEVATFLASGNVVFDHPGTDLPPLEQEIEDHLADALGFSVTTFVRPLAALERLVEREEIAAARSDGFNPHLIFLRDEAGGRIREELSALETEDDRFQVVGREVCWFRRGRLSDGAISPRDIETALGGSENTMRNLNTVQRIVSKFGG